MIPLKKVVLSCMSLPENLAKNLAIARCCLTEVSCIFLLWNISILKDLTINEKLIIIDCK